MLTRTPVTVKLTDEDLVYILDVQIPALVERRPDLEMHIYHSLMKTFASRSEVAALTGELREFREETRANFERVDDRFQGIDQRFEQVDQRFEQVDQRFDNLEARMEAGFHELRLAIDRLGARWGIRSESVFRQTIATLLEQSFGVGVTRRVIDGEEFDCLIFDSQHILVEIAASVGPKMQSRLERKRLLYEQTTGIKPARFILATASIHSRRAQLLREAGFEVIEPEEDEALEG